MSNKKNETPKENPQPKKENSSLPKIGDNPTHQDPRKVTATNKSEIMNLKNHMVDKNINHNNSTKDKK